MPLGYGGTAILLKKQIDYIIAPLDDGGKQIQCVVVNMRVASTLDIGVHALQGYNG